MAPPALLCAIVLLSGAIAAARAETLVPFTVTHTPAGDAIIAPLAGKRGDAARGKAILFDGERGNCTICHTAPGGDPRLQGNVGPGLAGVASRLGEGQLRLRLVDGTRVNPSTVMPPYYRVDGLQRVGAAFAGRPVLTADEIEDVVAYLSTLRD